MRPTEAELTREVEGAVAELRSMLQLDGADLLVVEADQRSATFEIVLEGVRCVECVLPSHMIQSMLAAQLTETLPHITDVSVRDPRDEADPDATDGG